MDTLTCTACGATTATPKHCGQAMHIETVDGQEMLVCWMGAGCGTKDLPRHCDASMRQAGA